MKHLLILAGNFVEYKRYIKAQRDLFEERGLTPIYLDPRSLSYMTMRNTGYVEVGSYYPNMEKNGQMYAYFKSHGIEKINL